MMQPDLLSLTRDDLIALSSELGWPSFRARQIHHWLWHRGTTEIEAMTTLSKEQRRLLAERFSLAPLTPAATVSDEDGTARYAFRLADGAVIESVYIPDKSRRTVCISTQVGCGLGCAFCATGRLGLTRSLAWHEIAGQVLAVRRLAQQPLTNVVFMGMGEPLLNLDAVVEAIRAINDDEGIGIGARHITVSTAGIPEGIRAYAELGLQTRLALSLNAADDATRSQLMPINRVHPLTEVLAAVRDYANVKGKRVTFEYLLVRGVNDHLEDAARVGRLLKGIPSKVNLIPLNPFPGCELEAPTPDRITGFERRLWPHVGAVTVRRSRGARIQAGCGQLAGAR